MAKFVPKFVCSFKMLKIVSMNLIIYFEGERTIVDLYQVYKFKNDNDSSLMPSGESQLPQSRTSSSDSSSSQC